ncbi:uncharacterized protein LOC124453171 [Xenia sp. Carnegie-2017]|uniref:uncharacterized protein LOC124453171 n=1 Tax=Xenia sp. Carnegie-2017 TaxID=2897299 RepID=UPI001F04576A|nr:uncharacterized protein LOC124453171 [Xenia sp. Carnegie-2017]
MFYDADKIDVFIVIFKFFNVFLCGLHAGECLFLSRASFKCWLSLVNYVDEPSLRVFRLSGLTSNLNLYRLNLLAIFAAIGVFVLEIRDKQYWLSGIMGLIFVLLYTKFYLAPLILKHVMDPDFNKSDNYTKSILVKIQHRHHGYWCQIL